MIMLKSVLIAIPTYDMSFFQLPISLCNKIQSALTRFWWDKNDQTKKMCWVSWDRMAKPKHLGGLGFKDISAFNEALLAKLSWRLLKNPNCLLARVLVGKYSSLEYFLDVQCPNTASHGWRGVLVGRDLLVKQLGWAIGNGSPSP
ncbi:hypothetical protein AtEden1_Chr3g0192351 [Arabidopsis thaliana]